jgi:hypothetical protein
LACPMCRYPFGSGGNRVVTLPSFLLACKSSLTIVRIKSPDGADPIFSVSGLELSISLLSRVPIFLRTDHLSSQRGSHNTIFLSKNPTHPEADPGNKCAAGASKIDG